MANNGAQPAAVAVTIVSPCIAFVFTLLRLYSRHFLTRTLGWDDVLIVVPMLLSIVMTYVAVVGIYAGFLGYHYSDIPWAAYDSVKVAKYGYIEQLLYNPILALVKNSVLILLLRLGSTKHALRVSILALIGINTAMMVAVFFSDMLQCVPIQKVWDTTVEGTCINKGDMFIATAALTILTDVVVVLLPTWIVYGLQMRLKKKMAVIFLLSLGLAVTAVSVWRLIYLVNTFYGPTDPDPLYGITGTAVSIEANLAIITACGPSMKPVILRWFPNFFGSSAKTTGDYGAGGGSSRNPAFGGSHVPAGAPYHSAIRTGETNADAFELHSTRRRGENLSKIEASDDDDSEKGVVAGITRRTDVNISYTFANATSRA